MKSSPLKNSFPSNIATGPLTEGREGGDAEKRSTQLNYTQLPLNIYSHTATSDNRSKKAPTRQPITTDCVWVLSRGGRASGERAALGFSIWRVRGKPASSVDLCKYLDPE